MRISSSSLSSFQSKLLTNGLFETLTQAYPRVVGRSVSPSEASSWRASLPRLEAVLRLADLPGNVWISLEERIPYYAKRADVVLFGYDMSGQQHMVVIELKAWEEATALDDGNVLIPLGGGLVTEPHPSAQVRGYQEHLLDFCKAFQSDHPMKLSSCAYCQNYRGNTPNNGLFHPQFAPLLAMSPTFGERDAAKVGTFLRARLSGGMGEEVLRTFDVEGIGPSKQLIDYANTMIQKQNVFTLLDEQLAANNAILKAVRKATKRTEKHVILIRGGPGTGKSVIALNTLGEALRNKLTVYFVTGSAAFTHGKWFIINLYKISW